MAERRNEQQTGEEIIDKGEQIQRLLYRILPYWPLTVLLIVLSMVAARIYLRYQIPVHTARTRIIVNDNTEQKSTNLQEIFRIESRNVLSETEREIQILSSRDLLSRLAIKLQLNVNYTQKGRIRTAPYDVSDVPFKLELENPDTVTATIIGIARQINASQVSFKNEIYPLDSTVNTKMLGNIRFSRNPNPRKANSQREVEIQINSINSTVNKLKQAIIINPISKQSSILDITYSDHIPERGVRILNELIQLYGLSAIDYKSRIYNNAKRFLDDRLSLVADELTGVERDLESFKTREGITDLGTEGSLYLSQLKASDAKIAEIDIQLEVLGQVNNYVTRRSKTRDSIPASIGFSDPVLNGLLTQLYQTETELARVREISGNKNPQIDVLEEVINRLRPGIITSVTNLRANLEATKRKLVADNSLLMSQLNRIPSKERLLLDISRQQAIKNAIYTFLLQKREESAIAAASVVSGYRLLEKPERGGIISPIPQKVYGLFFLAGMVIVVIYIYMREFASRRVLFRSQIEDFLSIPVVAELVYQEHMLDNPVVVGEGKRTLVAEQFRELRTNLNYITSASTQRCKIILCTSSIPKEGKSFVAINSAISLSLTGDKVVLIEFDMRKPKISKPLGITSDPGLSNYLVGSATEADIIKPHPTIKNLYVIPSGPIPPNPAELMTKDKLKTFFEYLRNEFDYVVIDSPPIAAVTDAKILSPLADATVYIVRHNYTNYMFLNLLNDVQQKRTLKNINIVFNGIKNKRILGYGYAGYGYGYGYDYGYGYNYGYGYTEDDRNKGSFLTQLKKKLNPGNFFRRRKR